MKRLVALLLSGVMVLLVCGCDAGKHETSSDGTPQYLDTANLDPDRQEIVELINSRIRFVNEGNEAAYMELFAPNSPISGIPGYRLKTVRLQDEIAVREQRNVYEGFVVAEDIMENGEHFTSQYVFIKFKQPEARWLIMDID